MSVRMVAVMVLLLMFPACVNVERGCGFGTSDTALMARVKSEMKRQGIAFEELPNGMVHCRSEDAERFEALLAGAEAAHLRSMNDERAGSVAILVDSPAYAACLSAELARRQIPFRTGTLAGKQSVEWRPESEAAKTSVLASCRSTE